MQRHCKIRSQQLNITTNVLSNPLQAVKDWTWWSHSIRISHYCYSKGLNKTFVLIFRCVSLVDMSSFNETWISSELFH